MSCCDFGSGFIEGCSRAGNELLGIKKASFKNPICHLHSSDLYISNPLEKKKNLPSDFHSCNANTNEEMKTYLQKRKTFGRWDHDDGGGNWSQATCIILWTNLFGRAHFSESSCKIQYRRRISLTRKITEVKSRLCSNMRSFPCQRK